MNSFIHFFRARSAGYHLWMFFLLTLLFAGIFTSFASYIVESFYGLSTEELINFSSPDPIPNQSDGLKLFQLISAIGFFVLPSLVMAQALSSQPEEYLGLTRLPKALNFALAIVLLFAALPIVEALIYLNEILPFMGYFSDALNDQNTNKNILLMTEMNSLQGFAFTFAVMAIIPAVGEELMFRGILQSLLLRMRNNIHFAAVFTGVIFGILHGQPTHFLGLFALGTLFGYLKEWTKNLWIPIVLHLINNGSLLVQMYFFDVEPEAYIESAESQAPDLLYLLPALGVATAIVFYFVKQYRKSQEVKPS